mmetsp:Transcript_26468/g.48699  ORF Transcript_26468/g.48699 Transcript_26468/m.48699 type:complete len:980 (-) Transcript_26468:129-3068(-)|eukprot:CAMPEP_0202006506 /NCGR_PEP_ID=MMETSP0905-20130828/11235_1 /ASSEMBLY_ACC=CAM_ASM_000554 /TAXON_ID=420261 /ORGANISM="Thalassiosira antarctica, Strain CCMP982" /LENGTH=979 /DNA_ID=CAMNT_0048564265 /DNA_START=76 /DNA_END=3015 /DNA_ORIENTATION=+
MAATSSTIAEPVEPMEPIEPMAMVRTSRNNNSIHHLLPQGFESCPHDDVCPSCRSTLILKAPTHENTAINTKNSSFSASRAAAAALEADCVDLQAGLKGNLASSLESAHSANLLLQALSFDAATREETRGLEPAQLAEGVSYCPECKVHVITSAGELERLFEEYGNENDNEEGSVDMEWLRGSLLVTVDDAEVTALQSPSRQRQRQQPIKTSPSSSSSRPQQSALSSRPQQSLLTQQSDVLSAHDTLPLPRHLQPKPTRPLEFDYEYRHKVATHAMASRIGRGYTLLDESCPECEMPLMKSRRKKECVVCPKLLKKIAKYHGSGHEQTMDPNQIISAIIKEAYSEAPQDQSKNRARRHVQPDIAEAKQYVMQRRIMGGTTKPNHPRGSGLGRGTGVGGCNGSEAGSQGTGSLTDHTSSSTEDHLLGAHLIGTSTPRRGVVMMDNPIDWEELLINGRTILSKRLNEGWILSSTNCSGMNCKGTPLLQRSDGKHTNLDYCVVCGGSGNGTDGAYERELELQAQAQELAEKAEREATPDWEELAGNGRALLAERLKQGWTMSSDNCCGYHCNEMPLTNFEGGPNSCVICGGSGAGCDGAYENYKPDEVVEEERALVSQELSRLLNMGWVLRESLCVQCLMPLVAEDHEAEEDLCILCGHLSENNPHMNSGHLTETSPHMNDDSVVDNDDSYIMSNAEVGNDDSYVDDSYFDEPSILSTVVDDEEAVDTTLNEVVNAPVPTFGDDNTDQAGKKLIMGWTLPDAGLCHHCQGIQMSPPNSHEIGCINRGCPSALAAAYTFLPEPHESTGPVKLIGRGFSSNAANKEKEDEEERNIEELEEEQRQLLMEYEEQNEDFHHYDNPQGITHEEQYLDPIHDDGPPLEVFGGHHHPNNMQGGGYTPHYNNDYYDEPSVLSDDNLSQVRSVASSALGVILVRLDDAKYELEDMIENGNADPQECAQKQVEIAMLIEKLASAAVAMKQVEY